MNESQLAESLAASGPAGAAIVFLGLVIRAWVARLEKQIDGLAESVHRLRNTIQERELKTQTALTALEGRVRTLEQRGAPAE